MFAKALGLAQHFTRPVVISRRAYSGDCASAIGGFVVINEQGWIVTAWHLVEQFQKLRASREQFLAYEQERKKIDADRSLTRKQKKKALKRFKISRDWATNFSFWWAWDGVQLLDIAGIAEIDLAIGRLEPFESSWIQHYPVLKDPSKGLDPGTSLCKLGFPFHDITPTYDEATNNFALPTGSLPVPFFPIEGMYTRNVVIMQRSGAFDLLFLETSSPGLPGQSGGAVFDREGTLWGIQSRTTHYELGFTPPVIQRGKKTVEHQFLNVGWAVHPVTLVGALQEQNVAHQLSSY